ncbi:MAG TPA: DUF1206 domain-containing protein, partial [Pilimelia sp.]|nr:DUF1206 domain-containing protein [Pilimelia sp.]
MSRTAWCISPSPTWQRGWHSLATLAAQPGGRALLWTVTVGLAMLVLWQLGEAAVGLRWLRPRNKRT